MNDNFWSGFEKQAGVFSSMGHALSSGGVSKTISGAAHKAKIQGLIAAKKAPQAIASPVQAAQNINPGQQAAKSMQSSLAKKVNEGYSPSFAERTKNLNPKHLYRKEGIGVDAPR